MLLGSALAGDVIRVVSEFSGFLQHSARTLAGVPLLSPN